MRIRPCDREPAVRRALADGNLDGALQEHVAGCRSCSDLVLVETFLQGNARQMQPAAPLPDPGPIWWRARLQARADAAERATWMIPALQRLALAGGALFAGLAVARSWPVVRNWLGALTPDSLLATGAASPPLVILGSLGVLVLLALFDFTHVRE
ncbi:MAG: hypothetical protein P8Y93_14410 [Acidobacteriota bacterium]